MLRKTSNNNILGANYYNKSSSINVRLHSYFKKMFVNQKILGTIRKKVNKQLYFYFICSKII